MPRKGNPEALLKAIRKNPRMSPAAKQKATRTLEAKIGRIKMPRVRGNRTSQNRGQGFEGFRETSVASVKLFSHPVDQAIEGYHVLNGIRKMWKAIDKWLNRH